MNEQKNLLIILGEWWEARRAKQVSQPTLQPDRVGRLIRWFIPNGGTLILIALLIATQGVWARPLQSPAAPGPSATTVNYQGRLANPSGNPLSGTYGMSFALYDAASGGSLVGGPEEHSAVPVSNGLFSVGLGSKTSGGIPTTTWNGDHYLEIAVGGETLAPRELIRSVPIAGMALTVPNGVIGTAQIADGAVTRVKAPELIASTKSNVEVQYGRVIAQAADTTTLLTIDIDFEPDFPGTPQVLLQPARNYTDYVIATYGLPCDRTKLSGPQKPNTKKGQVKVE